jgi:hypothetical protein
MNPHPYSKKSHLLYWARQGHKTYIGWVRTAFIYLPMTETIYCTSEATWPMPTNCECHHLLLLFSLALQPSAGYGLLVHEVSWSHTTTRHSRWYSSGWVISSSQRPLPDNTQHTQQTNIHAPGGIRMHDRSWQAAVDLRLRPRGHWDRHVISFIDSNFREVKMFSCTQIKEVHCGPTRKQNNTIDRFRGPEIVPVTHIKPHHERNVYGGRGSWRARTHYLSVICYTQYCAYQ